jgi:hypothetical protein
MNEFRQGRAQSTPQSETLPQILTVDQVAQLQLRDRIAWANERSVEFHRQHNFTTAQSMKRALQAKLDITQDDVLCYTYGSPLRDEVDTLAGGLAIEDVDPVGLDALTQALWPDVDGDGCADNPGQIGYCKRHRCDFVIVTGSMECDCRGCFDEAAQLAIANYRRRQARMGISTSILEAIDDTSDRVEYRSTRLVGMIVAGVIIFLSLCIAWSNN